MNKLRNVAIALMFIVAKVEGVGAQTPLVETNTESQNQSENTDPSALGKALIVNPYEYSAQKKADESMAIYLKEVAEEKRIKEQRKAEEAKKAQKTKVLSASYKKYADTRTNFSELYEKAGKAFGINPKLLQAVHIVETGGSGSTTRASYAGAQGPMQFMPATFRAYGVDGNGDGSADIYNVDDAVFSAAKYLAANGGSTNHRKALWHYNHSEAYIEKVLGIAYSLGM